MKTSRYNVTNNILMQLCHSQRLEIWQNVNLKRREPTAVTLLPFSSAVLTSNGFFAILQRPKTRADTSRPFRALSLIASFPPTEMDCHSVANLRACGRNTRKCAKIHLASTIKGGKSNHSLARFPRRPDQTQSSAIFDAARTVRSDGDCRSLFNAVSFIASHCVPQSPKNGAKQDGHGGVQGVCPLTAPFLII